MNTGTPEQAREVGALMYVGQPEYDAGLAAGMRAKGDGVTDEQGRIRALVPTEALPKWAAGDYRVVFRTGEFYARQKQETFFPEIPVVFHVDNAQQHTHVPLLLSPFGFSTYRGN